jgi:hypothetical protein
MEEQQSGTLKTLGILGGEIMALPGLGAALVNVGVSLQISLQAVGYIFPLRYHLDTTGNIFKNVIE